MKRTAWLEVCMQEAMTGVCYVLANAGVYSYITPDDVRDALTVEDQLIEAICDRIKLQKNVKQEWRISHFIVGNILDKLRERCEVVATEREVHCLHCFNIHARVFYRLTQSTGRLPRRGGRRLRLIPAHSFQNALASLLKPAFILSIHIHFRIASIWVRNK